MLDIRLAVLICKVTFDNALKCVSGVKKMYDNGKISVFKESLPRNEW